MTDILTLQNQDTPLLVAAGKASLGRAPLGEATDMFGCGYSHDPGKAAKDLSVVRLLIDSGANMNAFNKVCVSADSMHSSNKSFIRQAGKPVFQVAFDTKFAPACDLLFAAHAHFCNEGEVA